MDLATAAAVTTEAEELLRCDGVAMAFRSEQVLAGVSFALRRGEIVALVGRNGAGKSTLFRILAGLLRSWSGRLSFRGANCVAGLGARGDVSFSFDEQALFDAFDARDNIRLLATLRGAADREAALMERVRTDIPGARRKRLRSYSHGMKKRLLEIIAEDIISPRLLVLDEPTNGLDYEGIMQFEAAARRLAAQGTTVFFTSHYLEMVRRLADRVLVLADGVVAAEYRAGDYPLERLYDVFSGAGHV